tara:strand:- start:251 stop:508 length:258 start_codon:yes stop_codon:yes gene_type:complete
MKAINQYLIIEKIKPEVKKVAGLIMTELTDVDNSYVKGKIISTGNMVEALKDGDVVYFGAHAGHSITIKEKVYQVVMSRDIVLIE